MSFCNVNILLLHSMFIRHTTFSSDYYAAPNILNNLPESFSLVIVHMLTKYTYKYKIANQIMLSNVKWHAWTNVFEWTHLISTYIHIYLISIAAITFLPYIFVSPSLSSPVSHVQLFLTTIFHNGICAWVEGMLNWNSATHQHTHINAKREMCDVGK